MSYVVSGMQSVQSGGGIKWYIYVIVNTPTTDSAGLKWLEKNFRLLSASGVMERITSPGRR